MKFQEAVIFLKPGYLIAIKSGRDGTIYVAIPHICEQLGLDLQREQAAIVARPDLSWGQRTLRVWSPPGSLNLSSCLRSDLISTWLNGVAGSPSDPDQLKVFQETVAAATHAAFYPNDPPGMPAGAFVTSTVTFDEPPPPEMVSKLRRLVDNLHGTEGISKASLNLLDRLVDEAERLNASKDVEASDRLVLEVNRALGVDGDRA
ncbi:MAG: hypothetical protein ABSB96_05280 [Gaiellaceae bacterium]